MMSPCEGGGGIVNAGTFKEPCLDLECDDEAAVEEEAALGSTFEDSACSWAALVSIGVAADFLLGSDLRMAFLRALVGVPLGEAEGSAVAGKVEESGLSALDETALRLSFLPALYSTAAAYQVGECPDES